MKQSNLGGQDKQIANLDNELSSEEFSNLPVEERRKRISEKLNNDIFATEAKLETLKLNGSDAKEISSTEAWLEYLKDQKDLPGRVESREGADAERFAKEMGSKEKNIPNKSIGKIIGNSARAAFLSAIAAVGMVSTGSAAPSTSTFEAGVSSEKKSDAQIKEEYKAQRESTLRAELQKVKDEADLAEANAKKAKAKADTAKAEAEIAKANAKKAKAEKAKAEDEVEIAAANKKAQEDKDALDKKVEDAEFKKTKEQAQKDWRTIEIIENNENYVIFHNESERPIHIKEQGTTNKLTIAPGQLARIHFQYNDLKIAVEADDSSGPHFGPVPIEFKGTGVHAGAFDGSNAGKLESDDPRELAPVKKLFDLNNKESIYKLANALRPIRNVKSRVTEKKAPETNKKEEVPVAPEKVAPEKEAVVQAPEKEKAVKPEVEAKNETTYDLGKAHINKVNMPKVEFISFNDGAEIAIRYDEKGGSKVEIKTANLKRAPAVAKYLKDDYYQILKIANADNTNAFISTVDTAGVLATNAGFIESAIEAIKKEDPKDASIDILQKQADADQSQLKNLGVLR